MRILIFTSHNHWYANAFLGALLRNGDLQHDVVSVWEQDSLVPGKSYSAGLWKYVRISGIVYVFWQAVKQVLFIYNRAIAVMKHDIQSSCYPYYQLYPVDRDIVNGIKRNDVLKRIQELKPDLILSLFSKEIIPQEILAIPRFGAVNLHPAPLPDYRGVSPTFWAMAEGKKTHGVTLHVLDAGVDTGRIICQKIFSIRPYNTEHEIYLRCVFEGVSCVSTYLHMVRLQKRNIIGIIKNGKGSYRSLPTREMVQAFLQKGKRFI